MNNEFKDLSFEEMELVDGGTITIFGSSIEGLACGALAGAAAGPVGIIAGAIVAAGVTYAYDSL